MKDFLPILQQVKLQLKKQSKFIRQQFIQGYKQHVLTYSLFILPLLLLAGFLGLRMITVQLNEEIQRNKLTKVKSEVINPAAYPILSDYSTLPQNPFDKTQSKKDLESQLDILSAKAVAIMDMHSHIFLLTKNSGTRFPMASTTKIMTALVALDHYQLDDILQVYTGEIEGAKVGLHKEKKFLFHDVLYGMLLPSGNDAAMTIAYNYPGGIDAFIQKMNEKATQYHLFTMQFSDPSGLNPENTTTASDLARLSSIAMKNPIFAEVVSAKQKTIYSTDRSQTYVLKNLNKLLGTEGITGIKTGFTEEAGEVLVTSRFEDGHTLIIVIMKSEDRFSDTARVLTFIKGAVSYITFPLLKLQ